MKPILYVSAPFQLQAIGKLLAQALVRAGFHVQARWLDEVTDDPQTHEQMARRDVEDIRQCDGLVLINPAEWANKGTGGRHVECGIAFQQNKPIFIYGERSNVFYHLPIVKIATNNLNRLTSEIAVHFDA